MTGIQSVSHLLLAKVQEGHLIAQQLLETRCMPLRNFWRASLSSSFSPLPPPSLFSSRPLSLLSVQVAGPSLRPLLPQLVPAMLEALSGLEDQTFNYAEVRMSWEGDGEGG